MRRICSLSQAAVSLGVSRTTLYHWLGPAARVGIVKALLHSSPLSLTLAFTWMMCMRWKRE